MKYQKKFTMVFYGILLEVFLTNFKEICTKNRVGYHYSKSAKLGKQGKICIFIQLFGLQDNVERATRDLEEIQNFMDKLDFSTELVSIISKFFKELIDKKPKPTETK